MEKIKVEINEKEAKKTKGKSLQVQSEPTFQRDRPSLEWRNTDFSPPALGWWREDGNRLSTIGRLPEGRAASPWGLPRAQSFACFKGVGQKQWDQAEALPEQDDRGQAPGWKWALDWRPRDKGRRGLLLAPLFTLAALGGASWRKPRIMCQPQVQGLRLSSGTQPQLGLGS